MSADLQAVAPVLSDLAEKWTQTSYPKPSNSEEKRALKVLRRLHALIKKISTPAFFVTVNPHDLTSSMVAIIGGLDIVEWQAMSSFERAKFVANHPDVAAVAFDIQITNFVDVILRYKHGPGVFGHLHCHMLVWIAGNPSPQDMRDRMAADEHFQNRVFQWPEESPFDAKRPRREDGELDPRLQRQPQVREMDNQSFIRDYREFLTRLAIECNWHVHNDTCFKHLSSGDVRGDHTCRMRIDGTVQHRTCIEPETGSIELRRWRARVNNYTDVIMFLMQCNTDTQFIGSGEAAKAAAFYTSEYITKNDLPLHVGLKALDYAIKANTSKYAGTDQIPEHTKDRSLITKAYRRWGLLYESCVSHCQIL
ncbi:hypothetical protein C8R48DRAFT_717942 [Suillus tomentosus]|nr:hypothetical protein C8R48DRAFT_717942 [Suillus tomentosus]